MYRLTHETQTRMTVSRCDASNWTRLWTRYNTSVFLNRS